jgi:hypothetical protein
MKKLCITSAFHFNLDYSSIPMSEKSNVINICYRPLLAMFDRNNFKVGIEMSGKTLEDISVLSPETLTILQSMVKSKKVMDFFGVPVIMTDCLGRTDFKLTPEEKKSN